jgi:hypothetical protein
MHPTLLWTPESDSCQQAPVRDNVVQVVSRERLKGRGHFEKYFSMCCLGTTRLQVVNQSFAHLTGHTNTSDLIGDAFRDDLEIVAGVLANDCAELYYKPEDNPPDPEQMNR